ncbi:MlaD family protein [Nocardia sp. BMG51109]|uniref:MlaD family protein n=1 Tax=Nocardia sp. BMG51109 TaxID=1056816 RepID=UPI0018DB651C|nr:MlaD family protein [Nocardia sp. BMG51109]
MTTFAERKRRRPRAGCGRLLTVVVVTAAAMWPVTGCGFDPAQIPVPGVSVSGPTYPLHIEFANALNLPTQAKVIADGVTVGRLRSLTVRDPSASAPGHIVATVELSSSVRLRSDTTAQLRQNTLLGDIYIALGTPSAGSASPLAPGDTIPLQHTEPPLQVEDLMAGLSTFVGGGALHEIQEIVDQTNAVLPEQTADTARIFDILGRDIENLAANQNSVDRFLEAYQEDLRAVRDNPDQLDALLSERGSVEIPADVHSLVLTLGIIGSANIPARAQEWMAPLLVEGDAAAKAFVPLLLGDNPLDLDAPSNLNRLVALLRDRIIPFVERGPRVNVTGVTIADSGSDAAGHPGSTSEQVDSIVRTLRMIGVVR